MKYIVTILVLIGFCVSHSSEREIPEGVQEIMDNYVKDSTARWGFLSAKSRIYRTYDTTVTSSDIKVGVPVEKYIFRYDLLDTCYYSIVNRGIQELVKPISWLVPILGNDKCLYFMEVALRDSNWVIISRAYSNVNFEGNILYQVFKMYDSFSAENPILIDRGYMEYFHFPEKGDFNLIYTLLDSSKIDSLMALGTINNSKEIVKGLKKSREDNIDVRKKHQEKHPDLVPGGGNE